MKKLVILIPAFNEEESISEVLKGIPKKIPGIEMVEAVVVDDGSRDKTADIAREQGAKVISHPKNLGLGVTFQRGIQAALEMKADLIVNIDADGQFDPADILKLVAPILEGRAEFVTASRFIPRQPKVKMSMLKFLGNKFMSYIIRSVIRQKFYDVSCGFRAYSRDAAMRLNLFGKFTYTQEVFVDLAYKNVPILEVPVKVRGEREFGKSKVASNLFRYGYNTLKIIIMAFRDYRPLRLMAFFSLLFFIIGLLVGSFFLFHYIQKGSFRPHTWAGFVSAASFAMALFMLFAGVIMDMFSRMRKNQERLLYFARRRYYDRLSND